MSSSTPAASGPSSASTENTVFVRFKPPSANVRRHHLEDLFSQIGPIRKSSVIVPRKKRKPEPDDGEEDDGDKPAASYGFIKYTSAEDAASAASKLDHSTLRLSPDEVLQLRVERASDAATDKKNKNNKRQRPNAESASQTTQQQQNTEDTARNHKSINKAHRLILRNLDFYAKESHVKKALKSSFGAVAEVHIPKVPGGTHRGFCFVTFKRAQDAQACLAAHEKKGILIQKRIVSVALALNKTLYESNKKRKRNNDDKNNDKTESEKDTSAEPKPTTDTTEEANEKKVEKEAAQDESDDDSNDGKSKSNDDENSDSDSESDSAELDNTSQNEEESHSGNRDETAVAEKRALFVRNLPFDTTRHDLFEVFRTFGYITGIFLVKDRDTGIPKGTAFVSFRDKDSVSKALETMTTKKNETFVSQREATETQVNSGAEVLSIKGRRIFVSLALDKDTAATLVMEKASDRHTSGKDRRNLYLKGEGRVDNENETDTAWDDLPEQDKTKRQRAWSDKNSKLRSPIFFINPTRLSIRNLSKQVDEQEFKKLCADATQRGLEKGLVTVEDVIASLRASGDVTTREIMDRVDAEGESLVASFDEKNIRKHIPSVFIDRDFTGSKKSAAPSRGFGFVEFEHHAHALACLRELNNNLKYSQEFAAGGRHALELRKKARKPKKTREVTENDFVGSDGSVKVPRLIVEFTVENKAKARLQAEHRAQQQANKIKQRMESKGKRLGEKKKEKKKSRGARQRERKRKGLDEDNIKTSTTAADRRGDAKIEDESRKTPKSGEEKTLPKPKTKKPQKKRKLDAEDSHFEQLVRSYEAKATAATEKHAQSEPTKKSQKRWFED